MCEFPTCTIFSANDLPSEARVLKDLYFFAPAHRRECLHTPARCLLRTDRTGSGGNRLVARDADGKVVGYSTGDATACFAGVVRCIEEEQHIKFTFFPPSTTGVLYME